MDSNQQWPWQTGAAQHAAKLHGRKTSAPARSTLVVGLDDALQRGGGTRGGAGTAGKAKRRGSTAGGSGGASRGGGGGGGGGGPAKVGKKKFNRVQAIMDTRTELSATLSRVEAVTAGWEAASKRIDDDA